MKPQTAEIKSTPLKSSRELAKMLKSLPRDERLRIEGAIIWASRARQRSGIRCREGVRRCVATKKPLPAKASGSG